MGGEVMDGLKSLVGWILLIVCGIWALFGLAYLVEGVYANVTNGKAPPYWIGYAVQGVLSLPLVWVGFRLARGKRVVLGMFGIARPPK
jgi:hypothetical protein